MKIDKYIEGRYENEMYIDVAIIGMGMGHYIVISMTKDGQHFFFRRDGGSNGYDRFHNMKIYQQWNPLQPELSEFVYDINGMMSLINDDNIPISAIMELCHKGHNTKVDFGELTRDHDNIKYVNKVATSLNLEF